MFYYNLLNIIEKKQVQIYFTLQNLKNWKRRQVDVLLKKMLLYKTMFYIKW